MQAGKTLTKYSSIVHLALTKGKQGIDIFLGVYAAEVVAARHCAMKVLAIYVITNTAAGILNQPINHAEVLKIGQRIS